MFGGHRRLMPVVPPFAGSKSAQSVQFEGRLGDLSQCSGKRKASSETERSSAKRKFVHNARLRGNSLLLSLVEALLCINPALLCINPALLCINPALLCINPLSRESLDVFHRHNASRTQPCPGAYFPGVVMCFAFSIPAHIDCHQTGFENHFAQERRVHRRAFEMF